MTLIKYKRDKHGHPIGVLVAIGKEQIGYSLCHKSEKWNKEKALKIAIGRAETGFIKIPSSIYLDYYEMFDRSGRYFQQ